MTDAVTTLRREVCALHAELPRNGLVAWTSGNLSARVPDEDLMVIKASGVAYDEFGGEVPVGPFALIGDEEIGRGIVDTLAGHRSPAVLMRAHGVFTIGAGPRDAIQAAVMCEDVARTAFLARQLGPVEPLAADDVDALHHRYQNVYGQR